MANWATTAMFGDSSSEEWQRANLVPVTAGGQTFQVLRQAAPSFQGFVNDLAAAGYKVGSVGGYNYRDIRGSNKLSQHGFGNAIDINPGTNAFGQSGTDMPAVTQALADKYGLEWGRNWKRPDPMHFEWKGGGQPSFMNVDMTTPAATVGGADYMGAPMPWERFSEPGFFPPAMAAPEPPPMTPERFLMGMIGGQNPLRQMVFSKLSSLFT